MVLSVGYERSESLAALLYAKTCRGQGGDRPVAFVMVDNRADDHSRRRVVEQIKSVYLRFFDGVCASHTSATSMGTDWRDNDPAVEPMVEIYQGDRQNYERPGAPRSPSEGDSIGGWEPRASSGAWSSWAPLAS